MISQIEKYQRSILATLIADPKLFDKFAGFCDLVKWQAPYDGIYSAMKSGTRSIYLIAEHPEVKIKGEADQFLIELMKAPKEQELYVHQLIAYCADHTNAEYVKNKLVKLVNGDGDLNAISSELNAITGEISSLYRISTFDMAKLNEIQIKAIESNQRGENKSLKCGSNVLQNNLMGWHPGHLVVVGGNSSSGKTAFMLTCIRLAAQANNKPVAAISYELTERELHARLLGSVCEVQPRDILFQQLGADQIKKVHEGMGILENIKILIEKPVDSDIESLISRLRVLAANDVKFVAIDYLQLIGDKKTRDKYQRVGLVARRLKNIAHELDICVMVLSQFNRDNMKSVDKRPTMASLRDSGEIEEAADEIILLYRPEYFMQPGQEIEPELIGACEVIFAKGRSTGTGMQYMKYEKEYTRFSDPTDNKQQTRNFYEPNENF